MWDKEQKQYMLGTAGISLAAGMLFLFLPHRDIWKGEAVIIGLFFLQAVWGCVWARKIFCRFDEAGDVLAEIIGKGEREFGESQWQQAWGKCCEKHYYPGTLGRIYGQIWEAAQIIQGRERERQREQKYLRSLMDDISHQIKTPIASLQVFVDIFRGEMEKGNPSGELMELAEQAQKQLDRISRLVTGMLKLAQAESGMLPLNMKESPVLYTIERSVDALRVLLQERGVGVEISGKRQLLLKHDADWLEEAFVNLVKNAAEYAPAHSDIQIVLEENALASVISVEDTGPGVEQEELPKIFNRFYRVRRKEGRDGVGIGLSLAKSIIEAQGGIITVFSQTGRQSYTRFVVTFLKG